MGLDEAFGIRRAGSTVRREVLAGLATFATLSYILFVQPAVLSNPACGMDAGGVLFATCVASAVACFLMAWWSNLPVALAPAMGHNFFFVFTVCAQRGLTWQEALAANCIAGLLFVALSVTRFRESVMHAVPDHLKYAIAAGIGLLIATIGLEWSGIVVAHPATYVTLGDLSSPVAMLALFGLALTAVLLVLRVTGAFLIGILATAAAGWIATQALDLAPALVRFEGVVGAPPSPAGTAFHLDFAGLFARPLGEWLAIVGVFFVLALFDTIGTLLGVCERAGLLVNGRVPRAGGALAADAVGTVVGTALGTSTVTSYVESAAGVAVGGRTGLTTVVTGVCLLLALVFTPLLKVIGAGVAVEGAAGVQLCYPVIAPVLILIGALMIGALKRIDWDDPALAIPAFLTVVVMQLSISITEGIAWGFIATSALATVRGRARATPWVVHLFAALFVLRYVFL